MEVPQKTKNSGITPGHIKECAPGCNRDTCTPMFIAALFTTAKLLEAAQMPYTDEWNKKMWYLYTMEFYTALKKNEIMLFAIWNWRNIMLSKVSQAQKVFPHM
jgi:hypothetical protein